MKERIKKTFYDLNAIIGISGREQDVARYCRDTIAPYADEVEVMRVGNVIATLRGKRPGPAVMIAAHMDEIGIIIKNITPDGFLKFERIGGTQMKVLPGRRMLLKGDKKVIPGVVGLTPGHIITPQEANTVPAPKDCFIDIGAESRQEVEELGIHVGTTGTYDSPAMEMANPDLVNGRCVDDRINCAILLELAKELADRDFGGTLYITFTVQEEPGCQGAPAAVRAKNPDYFIALDTFPAGGTPDVPEGRLPVKINHGPVMSICDALFGALSMFHVDQNLEKMAKAVAKEQEIPLQYVTMCEESYATDALTVSKFGLNCPCMEFGMPRRYSHSPIEFFNLNDTVRMLNLLKGIVAKNETLNLDFIQD